MLTPNSVRVKLVELHHRVYHPTGIVPYEHLKLGLLLTALEELNEDPMPTSFEIVVNGRPMSMSMNATVRELQAVFDKATTPGPTKVRDVPPVYRQLERRGRRR